MADNLNLDGNIEVYPGPRGFSVVEAKGDGENVRFITDEPRTLNPVALPRGPKGEPVRPASIRPASVLNGAEGKGAASAGLISPLRQGESGYCRHKVFGRGKIVQFLPPDKYRVNFPGMGLKVIMGAYLQMEE